MSSASTLLNSWGNKSVNVRYSYSPSLGTRAVNNSNFRSKNIAFNTSKTSALGSSSLVSKISSLLGRSLGGLLIPTSMGTTSLQQELDNLGSLKPIPNPNPNPEPNPEKSNNLLDILNTSNSIYLNQNNILYSIYIVLLQMAYMYSNSALNSALQIDLNRLNFNSPLPRIQKDSDSGRVVDISNPNSSPNPSSNIDIDKVVVSLDNITKSIKDKGLVPEKDYKPIVEALNNLKLNVETSAPNLNVNVEPNLKIDSPVPIELPNDIMEASKKSLKIKEDTYKIKEERYNFEKEAKNVNDINGNKIATISPREAQVMKAVMDSKIQTDENDFDLDDDDIDFDDGLSDLLKLFKPESRLSMQKELLKQIL